MLARVLVLVAAVGVIAFGVTQLRTVRHCHTAQTTLLFALIHGRQPPGGMAAVMRELSNDCRNPVALHATAGVLTSSGHYAPALALARLAVARYPRSQDSWAALAQVLDRTDPAGAARARRRVHALNPQAYVPPVSRGIKLYYRPSVAHPAKRQG